MISGPFAQESSVHIFADARKLFKRDKILFFYIRSNTQMPLKNRNTILLPQIDWYSNSPFCIFYMNLVTILFFPKYFAFFAFCCLHWQMITIFWEGEGIGRKGGYKVWRKREQAWPANGRERRIWKWRQIHAFHDFISHYSWVLYIFGQTGELMYLQLPRSSGCVCNLARMLKFGHQTRTN